METSLAGQAEIGWIPGDTPPIYGRGDIGRAVAEVRSPLRVVRARADGRVGLALGGALTEGAADHELVGALPPLYPEWLGDRGFLEAHGVRFPYVAGAMANGIATPEMVIAMARANMLGFYGAAGLSFERVERGVDQIARALEGTDLCWGANLIHSPNEPKLEMRAAELFAARGVRRVSASAYMKLAPPVVRYAYSGLRVEGGQIVRPNHVFAKISRPETAEQFMRPAPKAMLDQMVARGELTAEEARLGATLPVAEDITVESDSGGHTDNRPLGALLPEILGLRDRVCAELGYARPVRVGAAGGLGTPAAVAAAFGFGAAYVLTGSVNQASVEAGLSPAGKALLAKAGVADVIMAPAADMFELGVEVQVLKRGTMFGPRGRKLYDIYHAYPSIEAIPQKERERLERTTFGQSLDSVWEETRSFWGRRDPDELARAEANPKHKMALVFRWYLGKASRWAIDGTPDRVADYQIWCGPAMGSFNSWVEGSFLEDPARRGVAQIALNLLEGAAVVTRAQQLRTFGVAVPDAAFDFRPRPLA
jgi:PfaD family protein